MDERDACERKRLSIQVKDFCNPMRVLFGGGGGSSASWPLESTAARSPAFINGCVLNALGFGISLRWKDQNNDMDSRPLDRFRDRRNTAE